MSEHTHKNLNDGPTGRWGYDSRVGRYHLDGSKLPPYRMERNRTPDSDRGIRNTRGSAIAIGYQPNAKWLLPYRIAIIAASGTLFITSLSLFLISCFSR